MNKYQEALDELAMYAGTNDMVDVDEYRFIVEYESRLKELVDRATPIKPEMVMVTLFRKEMPTCPADGCGVGLDPNESIWHKSSYCGNCGQKIDWSEDE